MYAMQSPEVTTTGIVNPREIPNRIVCVLLGVMADGYATDIGRSFDVYE